MEFTQNINYKDNMEKCRFSKIQMTISKKNTDFYFIYLDIDYTIAHDKAL